MVAVESLALAGFQLIGSPVMKKLVDDAFSYFKMDVPGDLKDLVDKLLPQIVIAMKASEEIRIDMPHLERWLQSLKDAYNEAEDILDEVEYRKITKKIKHEKSEIMVTSQPLIKPFVGFTDKVGKQFGVLSSNKRELRSRLNKLKNDIKGLMEVAKVLYSVPTQPNEIPVKETTSFYPQSTIFLGRDGLHKVIVDILSKEPVHTNKKPCSVIAIVGVGGVGKTTLAQHIYKDMANNFDTRVWVSLARKLEVIKHTKVMIEQASQGNNCPQSSNLEVLQSKLVDILSQSERALVVLDDLFYSEKEEEDWACLLAPLNSTNGSKVILVTSLYRNLPGDLESGAQFFDLKELTDGDSMELFRHHACFHKMDESPLKDELEEISVEIVQKMRFRLPLAIKSVASQFRSIREVNQARDILKGSKLEELNTTLMWSYQQLDQVMQRCFLFCSIFPKAYTLNKQYLVQMWHALNYIRSSNNKNVEDVGSKYFDELVSRFFFQPADENGRNFIIHDAFRELAESLSREECFRIENEHAVEIPSTVNHLFIAVGNIKQHVSSICKLDKLRTLIFLKSIGEDSKENLDEILRKSKKLRILLLPPNITQLPETVCELKYLKYLDFFGSTITQVPESLSSLHLLCVLYLPSGISSLPKSMSNLRNLRHVYVIDKNCKQIGSGGPPVSDVGKITSLQTLPEFHVKNEKGYELHQLGNLREIKGWLIITGLENVSNKDEAALAKMKDKNLDTVRFNWREDLNGRNSDLETIQVLQPPQNLRGLCIDGYSADRCPTWLGDESIRHVRELSLISCNALEVLPLNFHLWKYCEDIILDELRNLKELPTFPLRLKKLKIHGCPSLVLISEQELTMCNKEVQLNHQLLSGKEFALSKVVSVLEPMREGFDDIWYYKRMMLVEVIMFQQIGKLAGRDLSKELKILEHAQENTLSLVEAQLQGWWNCHQERVTFIYTRIPEAKQFHLPSSLTDLDLASCNITDRALSNCLRNLCCLKHLRLEAINSLVTLPLEETMLQLSRLRSLTIISCWLLRSLGAMHKLDLDKFEVYWCPCLEFENEKHSSSLPSSLQWLKIYRCTISSCTLCGEFPKLNYVHLESCRSSDSLSIEKLTSVIDLTLANCPDICSLSGFCLLRNLEKLCLMLLPKLKVTDHLQSLPICTKQLQTDSLEMLKIFSAETSFPIRILTLKLTQEKTFMSEALLPFSSLEWLQFCHCKLKSIPTNFTNLSALQVISFCNCPDISQLPELPTSVSAIIIKGCPVLEERCRRDGEDWPKIAHIKYKHIESKGVCPSSF